MIILVDSKLMYETLFKESDVSLEFPGHHQGLQKQFGSPNKNSDNGLIKEKYP